MNVGSEEFRKRYAEMSDEELALIKREELIEAARECYDAEVLRRSSSEPSPVNASAGSAVPVATDVAPGLAFFPAVLWAFVLFVGVGYFLFEDVAKWLGILCYLGGGALTLKIVSDQGRSAGLWAALSLMLGPVAALIVLALPRHDGAPSTRPTQLQRSLIALSPIVLCPVVVMVLLAITGQGSFRVVKTADISGGYDLRFQTGENFCGKVVNVEGTVIATGQSVPRFDPDPDVTVFAVSDGSGEASAKERKKTSVLSLEDRVSESAKISGNKRYPPPRVDDRVRVGVIVRCDSILPGDPYRSYTLLEVSRRPAQ